VGDYRAAAINLLAEVMSIGERPTSSSRSCRKPATPGHSTVFNAFPDHASPAGLYRIMR
jgi:hypothetical protein